MIWTCLIALTYVRRSKSLLIFFRPFLNNLSLRLAQQQHTIFLNHSPHPICKFSRFKITYCNVLTSSSVIVFEVVTLCTSFAILSPMLKVVSHFFCKLDAAVSSFIGLSFLILILGAFLGSCGGSGLALLS